MTFLWNVGSFFWGWLSDLKGRRLVLLITIFFNGLFSFLFGFVGTLELAMAVRFLAGLANGETVSFSLTSKENNMGCVTRVGLPVVNNTLRGPAGLCVGPSLKETAVTQKHTTLHIFFQCCIQDTRMNGHNVLDLKNSIGHDVLIPQK